MKSELIKQITNKAVEQLIVALNEGRSETLTQYLAAIGRFHRYSLLCRAQHNRLYVICRTMLSGPREARRGAGFRAPELTLLESFQERQQAVIGPKSAKRLAHRLNLRECFFLDCQIGMEIGVGGFDAFVSEPQPDHRDIYARLKQGHCGAVPDHVWRDTFIFQTGAVPRSLLHRVAQQQMNSEACQSCTSNTGECHRLVLLSQFAEPLLQDPSRSRPKRNRAILSTLPLQLNVALRADVHPTLVEGCYLRDARPCVKHGEQQRVVSSSTPAAAIKRGQDGFYLFPRQILAHSCMSTLHGDRQNTSCNTTARRIA
jgi:hypothetical protein